MHVHELPLLVLICASTIPTWCLTGCSSSTKDVAEPALAPDTAMQHAGMSQTDTQRPELCSRPGEDAVRDVFCAEQVPPIASLADLQQRLRIAPEPGEQVSSGLTGTVAVLLAHSTALSGRFVSPINPRVILPGTGNYTLMAFQRGVQRLELASMGRDDNLFNFYLITFRQACNATEAGCSPGDLYTSRIETNWAAVDIRDDEDLKNTPSDCRQCHQRGRDTPLLLMRELRGPWTHFFGPERGPDDADFPGINASDLPVDYQRAKGREPYAGIPVDAIARTTGFALETIMEVPQPLFFDAPTIVAERWPYRTEGWSDTPQRSPTWDRAYAAFKRGEQLALPYFDTRATDPAKQDKLSDAYQRYLAGESSADDLPDLAEIFPDDPQVRAEIGLQTELDATPAEALIQACGSCHNDVLDQSISRARFNVGLATMGRPELELAIERLGRRVDAPGVMPPPEARQLAPGVRERLIDYLRQDEFPASDREQLARAALYGMAGGAQPE